MPITVLVADDHPLVRDALVDLLTDADDIEVVAACADGSEVLEAVGATTPDVVLMDLHMPVMDGLEAARALFRTYPTVQVALLTGELTAATVQEADELGVAGYLLKEDRPDQLPGRIRAIAAGGSSWSPAAAAMLEASRVSRAAPVAPAVRVGQGSTTKTSERPDTSRTLAKRGVTPRMTASSPILARVRAHLTSRDRPLESM